MIGIINYGMGNLHSVTSAINRLGYPCFVSDKIDELTQADGLVLPGVGSFHDAMRQLTTRKLKDFIIKNAQDRKPLLGICLGMQLLFEESDENRPTKGLALFKGRVKRLKGVTEEGESYNVPHMGWNSLDVRQSHRLLKNVKTNDYVYFVHSYVVVPEDDLILATADYYGNLPAVVGHRHIFGTQFHPEKSSAAGLMILKNFCEIVKEGEHERIYSLSGH
ncbi:imidazole glycerol phosphate synthase subunit HisH [Camelliibacillus cellulosilyticus]|uniref:Imidazole glycerol phosphate synthase subunit HisH n=1 Tax=Camelliibacillus cellulosilyticus TaxID=2174486 RepID=A0ABV9GKG4_9BACL